MKRRRRETGSKEPGVGVVGDIPLPNHLTFLDKTVEMV